MKIPFTVEQFFEVFEAYNRTLFPIQLLFAFIGILALFAIIQNRGKSHKWIGYYLSGLWLWVGIVYHFLFFTTINVAAYGFGVLFIVQGILLLRATYTGKLHFLNNKMSQSRIGIFFVSFSLLIYPFISYLLESETSKIISVGLPCPTTIMTFGLFLFAKKLPKSLLVLPTVWALIGTWAAIDFGVYQDYAMLLSAVTVIFFKVFSSTANPKYTFAEGN